MITQFGMYPRFFVKKRDVLYPIIEKYTNEPLQGKNKGQVIKIYFNLLRSNPEFKAEIDAMIKEKGGKLLTIQERIFASKGAKQAKMGKESLKPDNTKGVNNFLSAEGVTNTETEAWDEASFIKAVGFEEGQEAISTGLKLSGIAVVIYFGWKFLKP